MVLSTLHYLLTAQFNIITMEQLKQRIDKQIKSNSGKNIFHDNNEAFQFIRETAQTLSEITELDALSEQMLVNYATDKAISEFCRINQYYSFNTKSKNKLRNLYTDLFSKIRTTENTVEELSAEHYKNLRGWVKEFNPFAEKLYSDAEPNIKPVACSEYSSDLQVDILGIDENNVLEPVLDIGCGKLGKLVKSFRIKGIDSLGIDRFPFAESYLLNCDWLEFDYEKEKWGTIISNLGFSNHFKHHHLRADGNYIEYARKYMDILNSLKVGGRFYYAPDLPFIEQYLDPQQYRIAKKEIGTLDFKASTITKLK